MFIKCNQLPERIWCQLWQQKRSRWTVATKDFMRDEAIRHVICLNFIGSFAECQRLGLSKYISRELEVMLTKWVQRAGKADKVTWY